MVAEEEIVDRGRWDKEKRDAGEKIRQEEEEEEEEQTNAGGEGGQGQASKQRRVWIGGSGLRVVLLSIRMLACWWGWSDE